MKKTFKREVAIALLVWFFYIVETKEDNIIEILSWPVFSYITAAFLGDAYSKLQQRKPSRPLDGRGPERSSQYPSGEDK